MRNVVSAGRVRYRSVEMEWQQFREWRGGGVGRVTLLKCCALIGKTPDAAVASEVVIERTVFLDQDEPVEVPTEAPPQPEKASDAISAAAAMPLASRVLAGFPCGQSYKL